MIIFNLLYIFIILMGLALLIWNTYTFHVESNVKLDKLFPTHIIVVSIITVVMALLSLIIIPYPRNYLMTGIFMLVGMIYLQFLFIERIVENKKE